MKGIGVVWKEMPTNGNFGWLVSALDCRVSPDRDSASRFTPTYWNTIANMSA